MEALVGLITFVGLLAAIVGLVLMIPKSKRKLGTKLLLSGTIVFIIGVVLVINVLGTNDDDTNVDSEPVSTETEKGDKPITKEQYESVRIGDTQEKVKKELGEVGEGNISDIAEGTEWTYSKDDLGLAYILFSNDDKKVIKKSEMGMLSDDSHTETTANGTVDLDDWETQVKDIASSSDSKTEKFDAVSKLASDYSASDEELKEFQDYIINEYKTGKYLKDINNDEYMLINIFKSAALDERYGGSNEDAVGAFAFDFLQNTKYTYRGVDAVDSETVKSNEHQMDKALSLIK